MEIEVGYVYTIAVDNTLNLKIGETKQLNPIVKENGNVVNLPLVFTSSDTNISTVDNNGLITCIADRTCKIQVALKDHVNINVTIDLTIKSVDETICNFDDKFNTTWSEYGVQSL